MQIISWLFGAFILALGTAATAETLVYTTYSHNDHLGSPVAATDERGDLLWRAHFRPYGERQENPTDAAFGNVGYTGHTQDADSGLVYMQARYYDPVIGRFMAVDPAEVNPESTISFNRYAYANNNPMRFFDPDGRNSKEPLGSGPFVPGFETNIFIGGGGLGPITGAKRGLTPQGELVNSRVVKGADGASNVGRSGKQSRLRELENDDKLGKADRGWIRQEINSIERGQRSSIRNPPGKDLAHERGREAAKGYGYKHSNLQDRDLHRLQHKYDDFGRANKERPLD